MDQILFIPAGFVAALFAIYFGYPGGVILAFLPAIYCEIASNPPVQSQGRSRRQQDLDPSFAAYKKAVLPVALPLNLNVLLSPLPLAALGFGLFSLGVVTPKPAFSLLNGAGIAWMVLAIGTTRDYTFDPLRRRERQKITKVYGYQVLIALAIFAVTFLAAFFAARTIPPWFEYVRFSPVHLAGFALGVAGLYLSAALGDKDAPVIKSERDRWDKVFGAITSKTEGLPVLEDIDDLDMVKVMTFRAGLVHSQSSENAVSALGNKLAIGTGSGQDTQVLLKSEDGVVDPNLFLVCEKKQGAEVSKTADELQAKILIEMDLNQAQKEYGDPTIPLYLTEISLCTEVEKQPKKIPNILRIKKPVSAPPSFPSIFLGTPSSSLELISDQIAGIYDPGNTSLTALEGMVVYGDSSMEHLSADSPLGQILANVSPDAGEAFDEVVNSIEVGAEWASHYAQITINGISDTNRPRLQWAVRTSAEYGGNEILSESFLTRQGVEMDQILTASLEKQLSTTLKGAGFVSAVPYYMRGARHPLAFTVRYCDWPYAAKPRTGKRRR
ncbi:hypothetical protein CYK25_009160 [Varibaculum cambriense]|nr:hypothetical protein CYK25_009160 [Varibaculum cambriense]